MKIKILGYMANSDSENTSLYFYDDKDSFQLEASVKPNIEVNTLLVSSVFPSFTKHLQEYNNSEIIIPSVDNIKGAEIGKFTLKMFKVDSNFSSNGIIITNSGEKVSYIPNILKLNKKVLYEINGSNVLFFDGYSFEGDNNHLSIKKAVKELKELDIDKVYFINLSKETLENKENINDFLIKQGNYSLITKTNFEIVTNTMSSNFDINAYNPKKIDSISLRADLDLFLGIYKDVLNGKNKDYDIKDVEKLLYKTYSVLRERGFNEKLDITVNNSTSFESKVNAILLAKDVFRVVEGNDKIKLIAGFDSFEDVVSKGLVNCVKAVYGDSKTIDVDYSTISPANSGLFDLYLVKKGKLELVDFDKLDLKNINNFEEKNNIEELLEEMGFKEGD